MFDVSDPLVMHVLLLTHEYMHNVFCLPRSWYLSVTVQVFHVPKTHTHTHTQTHKNVLGLQRRSWITLLDGLQKRSWITKTPSQAWLLKPTALHKWQGCAVCL